MTRVAGLAGAFENAARAKRAALIGYIMAGDPDIATSAVIVERIARAGVDIIELGIPYGDPLADGPTIAAAGQRALGAGTSIDAALGIAARVTSSVPVPMVAFTYFNPIVQYGLARFAERAAAAGISGAIVPDLPLEELGTLHEAFRPFGISVPLLIAPTTPLERAREIASRSAGFVYLVSRLGVTGASKVPDVAWIADRVSKLRASSDKMIAVGFGISTAAHVASISAHADGVIIGSALIDAYAGAEPAQAADAAERYVRGIVPALSR